MFSDKQDAPQDGFFFLVLMLLRIFKRSTMIIKKSVWCNIGKKKDSRHHTRVRWIYRQVCCCCCTHTRYLRVNKKNKKLVYPPRTHTHLPTLSLSLRAHAQNRIILYLLRRFFFFFFNHSSLHTTTRNKKTTFSLVTTTEEQSFFFFLNSNKIRKKNRIKTINQYS